MSKLIQRALDLQDGHLRMWKPYVTPRHPYFTRSEKKRIHTSISKRDNEFIKRYLSCAATLKGQAERITNSITVFSYLVNEPFLLQNQRFRTTVWDKMNEFEAIANREMARIHAIQHRETYESFAAMSANWEDLLHVIWHLRDVIRK
jgi:hypothetical protein